jgi:hypothetical protein
VPQFGERAFGEQRAVIDDAEAIAEPLRFVEIMRGVDDRRVRRDRANQVEDCRARLERGASGDCTLLLGSP